MDDHSVIGIQTCKNDFAAHYRKITIDHKEKAQKWLRRHCRIQIWNWSLRIKPGCRKKRTWQPRIVSITHRDFEAHRCDVAETATTAQ